MEIDKSLFFANLYESYTIIWESPKKNATIEIERSKLCYKLKIS